MRDSMHPRRIDPDRNMARFYSMSVHPGLFVTASHSAENVGTADCRQIFVERKVGTSPTRRGGILRRPSLLSRRGPPRSPSLQRPSRGVPHLRARSCALGTTIPIVMSGMTS
jgi:hypothetical protein